MRRLRAIGLVAMVGGLLPAPASGQMLANPIMNVERAPAGSVESDVLDRLASMHRYDPRDLFRLSRLTVLESIAMYENFRADAPATMLGAGREGEMSALWDAAELFYVSATPSDVPSLIRSRPLLADVEAAYDRLSTDLSVMPSISPQAALHMRNIARILPVMNNLIDAMEADQGIPVGVPAAPVPPQEGGIGRLREQARGLVADLRGVQQAMKDAKAPPGGRDALLADLDGLIDLVQGLDRMLADGAPARDIIEALGLIRGRMWPIQARSLQLAGTPVLAGRWRPVRQRLDGLSAPFGRPRVIAPGAAAATRPAAGVDRRPLAQADRAISAIDEYVSKSESNGNPPAGGLQYREELDRLRRLLFRFREQAAAGEPPGALRRSLVEIEDLNRRLGQRARSESRVFRGGVHADTGGLTAASQAVEALRESIPKAPPDSPDHR